MLTIEQISKIGPQSLEEFRYEYLYPQKPVVICDGLAHWPASERWTDNYLLRHCGDVEVNVKSKSDYKDGVSMRESEAEGMMGLRAAINYMTSDSPSELSYVRETDILQKLPKLREDVIDPPQIPPGTNPNGPLLWIGPSGTKAQMHWDPWNNLFGQIRGSKKFILLPHEQAHLTYPNQFDIAHAEGFEFIQKTRPQVVEKMRRAAISLRNQGFEVTPENYKDELPRHLDRDDIACLMTYLHDINNCHVDAEFPDFNRHPMFRDAEPVELVLEAGDLLFIPCCHLHYVRSLEPSISINWFFDQSQEEKSIFEDSKRIATQHLEP